MRTVLGSEGIWEAGDHGSWGISGFSPSWKLPVAACSRLIVWTHQENSEGGRSSLICCARFLMFWALECQLFLCILEWVNGERRSASMGLQGFHIQWDVFVSDRMAEAFPVLIPVLWEASTKRASHVQERCMGPSVGGRVGTRGEPRQRGGSGICQRKGGREVGGAFQTK